VFLVEKLVDEEEKGILAKKNNQVSFIWEVLCVCVRVYTIKAHTPAHSPRQQEKKKEKHRGVRVAKANFL